MRHDRLSAFCLAVLLVTLSSCDESGPRGDSGFPEAGLGVYVVGEAYSFAWSRDGERLYYSLEERATGGGTRSGIYMTEPGGSPELLFESTEGGTDNFIRVLIEGGQALFFQRSGGRSVVRLPLDGSPSDAPVTGASHFAVSGDGRRLAYATAVDIPREIRLLDLETSEEVVVAEGTFNSSSLDPRRNLLLLSEDGSHLFHSLADTSGSGPATYSLVDIANGNVFTTHLGAPDVSERGARFFFEGDEVISVFNESETLVVQRLPGGEPRAVADFPRRIGLASETTVFGADARPGRYAFWRRENGDVDGGQPCAVHVIDLASGEERRVAGPVPTSGQCGDRMRLSPDGSRVAYQTPGSTPRERRLYVAEVEP